MIQQTFTFGFSHTHPITGEALGGKYVVIEGNDAEDCRKRMIMQFGNKWSFQYDSPEAAGVGKYADMHEVPFDGTPEGETAPPAKTLAETLDELGFFDGALIVREGFDAEKIEE